MGNEFLHMYPNNEYKTGHMGLTLSQLREINSDEGLKKLGLMEKKLPFWKKIFKQTKH